jgi:plasmid stabilization system protein ParE
MALKVTYSKLALFDLNRFRIYYEQYFPEGIEQANTRMIKCVDLMRTFPAMGRIVSKPPRRCFSNPDTPYTLVYQHKDDRLEIVCVLDQRAQRHLQDLMDT